MINSCVKRGTLWQLDSSISPLYQTKVLWRFPGESLVNQDTQKIAPDDDVVVVCLKPESIAYEGPPGGLVTGVSGSFIIVDVVKFFFSTYFCSNYLPTAAEGTTK